MTSLAFLAERLADEVLFPSALATDSAERVPEANLRALADAGLFAVVGPPEHGGLGLGMAALSELVELLASGCLSTAFVWVQHHGAVEALASSSNRALADAWLPDLCAGRRRAGIALSGARPGPGRLVARAVEGGFVVTGTAPWVTAWGLTDTVLTVARSVEGASIRWLLDPVASDTLSATAVPLVAANASRTVELSFREHFVPREAIVSSHPHVDPPAHDGGGRSNGSLALGVARRACRLMGPTPLDAQLTEARQRLDEADEYRLASARAAAVELCLRATAAAITTAGSHSIAQGSQAQRLAREALFLLVFGSRTAIRKALLEELGAAPSSPT